MKEANEITVEVDTTLDNLNQILTENNFRLTEELDYNDIYMVNNNCIEKDPLKILDNCIIIRNILTINDDIKQLVYKRKNYNDKKEILSQSQVNCHIVSLNEAQLFLEKIGYHKLIAINDHIKVYTNDKTEFAVQLVNGKHIYIELEQENKKINRTYSNIEEMKEDLQSYNIPIKNNDYFVKKAEIEILESMKW